MKNITLSADDDLIEAARARGLAEHTTLDEQFRQWLAGDVQRQSRADLAINLIDDLRQKLKTGARKFTRDEMNER